MKFVIKSGSTVKLYSGEIKFEDLSQFLKENFSCWNTNNLVYTDKDGDKITITTQEDLEVYKHLLGTAQYGKLEILPEQETKISEIQQTEEKVEKKAKSQKKDRKKSCRKSKDQSINKDQKEKTKERKHKRSHSHSRSNSHKKRHHGQKERHSRKDKKCRGQFFEHIINAKVAELVDQRIKALIPCIKNQVDSGFEVLKSNEKIELIHTGVYCNGCNMLPISGIRYKCLICPTFNLCAVCEEKIDHQHNLLKVKNLQIQDQRSWQKYRKHGKKFFKHMRGKSTSSSSQSLQKDRQGNRNQRRRRQFDCEKKKECRYNRRYNKLVTMFGQRDNFNQFIERTLGLKAFQMVERYAEENNIDKSEFESRQNDLRKQKLAAFYDCPKSQFDQVIEEYSDLSFRQIIKVLKVTGKRDYSGENFKRMRNKLRDQKNEKIEVKVEEPTVSKPEEKVEKVEIVEKLSKQEEDRQKGAIFLEMQELFGDDKKKEIFNFINQYFESGKEEIIDKWIKANF